MKKKVLCMMLTAIMLLSACGGSTGSGGTTEDTYELKFAGQDAEGIASTEMMHWIANEVETRTNGKVTMKVYPSNQLGEAKLLYEGVMDGSVDMYLGYLDPTYDIAFDIPTIPFLADSYEKIGYLCSEESNCYRIFKEHCESTDMRFLGFFLNGVNDIFSTKPLGDYLDISAKKDALIRIVNSKTYSLGVEALGYPTISIPWSDTYTSLQTGVMDGMIGIPSFQVKQNFGDLVKYYLPISMCMEAHVIIMSPKTADKLPPEYLEIVEAVCAEASKASLTNAEDNVNAGIQELADMGVEILPITDEERLAIGTQVLEKITPELEQYFGKEIIDQVYADIENAGA